MNGIAVEGYQKSDLKGRGIKRSALRRIVERIAPAYKFVKLDLLDLENGKTESTWVPSAYTRRGGEPRR